jgi:nucleoside-diphosphate-sugar epimerase
MKRILITGAAGFLGSHLCDRFIKEGYQVVGMDNLITGDLKNIEHLFPHPHILNFIITTFPDSFMYRVNSIISFTLLHQLVQ